MAKKQKKPVYLTPEQRQELVERYKSGKESQVALARVYGIHPVTVNKIIGKAGARKPRHSKKTKKRVRLSSEQRHKLIERYKTGKYTLDELAELYSISRTTVVRIVGKEKHEKKAVALAALELAEAEANKANEAKNFEERIKAIALEPSSELACVRDDKGRLKMKKAGGRTPWTFPGPQGFYAWLKEYQPKVYHKGRYQVFIPTDEQKDLIDNALALGPDGTYKHDLSLTIQPRRHGKSTVFALIMLWMFSTRKNFNGMLLGGIQSHAQRVMAGTLRNIINHTPKLVNLIPKKNQKLFGFVFPENGNRIDIGLGTAGSFGDRLDLLWVSDFHAHLDYEPFHAMQASLLDSEGSLCLIDSNMDAIDGPVHALEKEAKDDDGMFCKIIQYRNFEEFCEKAPTWIDRKKAKRLKKTTLPVDFKRDILGQRSNAVNSLFTSEIIERCLADYKVPVDDVEAIAQGRQYRIGGGLDRAKSLFRSVRSDATVWTVVMKVASPEHGEPEIYILNQEVIFLNSSRAIKKAILKDHERYHLDAVALENYEVADIGPWLGDQKINYELISATDTAQNASFPELFRTASEGRLHFPRELDGLQSEMQTFVYIRKKNGRGYSFGHASSKFHDDRVYSLNWAMFALRQEVLNSYVLHGIQCIAAPGKRGLCFLLGGDVELLCKYDCPAYHQVDEMFRNYKQVKWDSELTLPEFYERKVKLDGAKVYQAI